MLVGLGNPGTQYEQTRHNIGFRCVDAFCASQNFATWVEKTNQKSLQSIGTLGNVKVIAVKPTTFMNLSGEAVQATAHFYKVPSSEILVVHDEYALPFGQLRSRSGGSSAGHNGIKSLIQYLGADFKRLRVGIAANESDKTKRADFVLAKFTPEEETYMPNLLKETTTMIVEYIYGGQLPSDTRNFII